MWPKPLRWETRLEAPGGDMGGGDQALCPSLPHCLLLRPHRTFMFSGTSNMWLSLFRLIMETPLPPLSQRCLNSTRCLCNANSHAETAAQAASYTESTP